VVCLVEVKEELSAPAPGIRRLCALGPRPAGEAGGGELCGMAAVGEILV